MISQYTLLKKSIIEQLISGKVLLRKNDCLYINVKDSMFPRYELLLDILDIEYQPLFEPFGLQGFNDEGYFRTFIYTLLSVWHGQESYDGTIMNLNVICRIPKIYNRLINGELPYIQEQLKASSMRGWFNDTHLCLLYGVPQTAHSADEFLTKNERFICNALNERYMQCWIHSNDRLLTIMKDQTSILYKSTILLLCYGLFPENSDIDYFEELHVNGSSWDVYVAYIQEKSDELSVIPMQHSFTNEATLML